MGGEAAVQVAVRLRPFNGRERNMDAKRCVDMEGSSTLVYEEDGKLLYSCPRQIKAYPTPKSITLTVDEAELEPRRFEFDYSMWYVSQEKYQISPTHPVRPITKSTTEPFPQRISPIRKLLFIQLF